MSSGIFSTADGDDPLGLDLLRKIERENALLSQQSALVGPSSSSQVASHVSVIGDASPGSAASLLNSTSASIKAPSAGRPGEGSQIQLLAQILSNNSSSMMTTGLLASASSGVGTSLASSGRTALKSSHILSPSSPPVVTNPGNQTRAEGAVVSLQIQATNPSGNPLVYGSSGLPAGLTIDAASGLISGTVAYTDAETQSGHYSVTVTAYDSVTGASGSASFTWTVTDLNTTPVLPVVADQTNWAGDGVAMSMAATETDGDPITYSASGLPTGLSINATTGMITGVIATSAAINSPFAVTVTATDGIMPATQSFNWIVQHVVIDSPGDQTNLDSDTVSRQINAWNPYGQSLTYSATGLPSGVTINTATGLITGTLSATASNTSPYAVTVTATDGTYHASTAFNWNVSHLAVETPGDKTNAEGDLVSLQMVADINTTQTLTYSATGLPSGLSINTSNGLISGTVANLDANSSPYSVTVTASDGTHNANQTFNWTVTHVLLTNPGQQINAQGSAVSLQIQASDPDNDHLTYGASGLPSGLTVNTSTGLISGTISNTAGAGSPYTVSVTAADATHTATQTFTWSVTNASVTVTNPGTQNSADGATVSLQINASDTAGDPLSFTAVGLPPGLGIDYASGLISGAIDPSAVGPSGGSFTVTVMADNGLGKTGSQSFTWNVTYTNQTPVITNPGDQLNLTGDVVGLTVWGYDPDSETVSYAATNLPAGLSINASTGVISGTISSSANTNSPYNVTVTASDGTLQASQTLTWTVTNNTVTVTQPADQTNTEGDSVSLPIVASSTYGFALSYSAHSLPTGLSIYSTTGQITGTIANTAAEDVLGGEYTTTVTVSDGHGHSGARAFNWAVADSVQAPSLTNPGAQNTAEGGAVSLQIQATDPNGLSLAYTASGLPTGLFIDSFTGLISGTIDYSAAETSGGIYTTLIAVNDGQGGTASQSLTWTVTNTDLAPWLAYPRFQTNKVGDSVSLQLAAGDYDGDSVTYSATGLPAGLSINGATGLVSGTITASAATYSVTATASDGHLTINKSFSWQVTSSATGQVILAINDTVDTSDDLAFLNPGQPVQTVPIQVTLVNASSGLHPITLSSTPSGRVSLSSTSFQLANGGTTTVMLTPLQLSQAEDDVGLFAFVGGMEAGDGKVTVEKATIDPILAADTPKGMPDRIPPREKTKVNYTLSTPLPDDAKFVWIELKGASALNGDASFDGTFGALKVTESGSFEIAGDAGKQTAPPGADGKSNAGKLTVVIGPPGPAKPWVTSAGFSVAAIPIDLTFSKPKPYNKGDNTGMEVRGTYSSDSGKDQVKDLSSTFISENVVVTASSGTLEVPAATKPIQSGYARPTGAVDDFHVILKDYLTDVGVMLSDQVFSFFDERTGDPKQLNAKGIPSPTAGFAVQNSGFTITRTIAFDKTLKKWRVTTRKEGHDDASVKVTDSAKEGVVREFKSQAGKTDPEKGLEVETP